jgi:hypothetical protein
MSIVKQKSDGRGSLKDIQLLINRYPNILNQVIIQKNKSFDKEEFEWLSPLDEDGFAEFRDDDFIDLLDLELGTPLIIFWPKSGPQWDALGKSKNGAVFLVEAKANIPEMVSPATQAGQKSRLLINKSLNETKLFLNINNDVDWSGKFYQYTNRLAHLYFLRVINGVDAYQLNIYFLNDKAVKGPKTKEEWEAAIQVMKSYLGVGRHKLSKYMIDVFIDVNEMK